MQKKKPFNYRPVVFIVVSLCLGIATIKFGLVKDFGAAAFFIVALLLVGGCVFLPAFNEYNIKEKIVLSVLCLVFFGIGCLSFNSTVKNFDDADLNGHYYHITAKIVDAKESDSGQHLVLSDASISGNIKGELDHKIKLYVYGNGNFDVGDIIKFSAFLFDNSSIYEGQLSIYNILRDLKYTAEINADEIALVGKSLTVFERINLFVRDTLKSGLDDNEFGVGYALIVGNSDFMDQEILSQYRMAGVAHIFAVSGLHIGFLAVAISWIFDKFRCNRLIKAIVVSSILFLYSGVCGFTSSSIRAAIMTAVSLSCAIRGSRYDPLTAIALAAGIILLYSPISLFEVGFQLSFVVVIGIVLLSPPIKRALKFLPKKLAESLSVAIAAQIASIPVTLYHFGTFSLIAVLLNVVFIPVISVVFTGLFLLTIVGGLFNIAKITLFIPNYLLKFINFCISAVDFEIFMVYGVMILVALFFAYGALLFISEHFNLKILTRAISSAICLIIALACCVFSYSAQENAVKAFVIGTDKVCATVIDGKNETIMIVSSAKIGYSTARFIRLSQKQNIKTIDSVIFLNGVAAEEQAFLTKLRTAFTFKRICYYGEEDKTFDVIIKKSFGEVETKAFIDGENLNLKTFDCRYDLDGRALCGRIFNQSFAITSSIAGINYTTLEGEYSLMIACDMTEGLFGYYKPKTAISYRRSALYLDGESSGTAVYVFNH